MYFYCLSVYLHVCTYINIHSQRIIFIQLLGSSNKIYLGEFSEGSLLNFNRKKTTMDMERPTREFKPFTILLFTHSLTHSVNTECFNMCKNNIEEFFKISRWESVTGSNNLLQCLTIGTLRRFFIIYNSKLFSYVQRYLISKEETDNVLFIKLRHAWHTVMKRWLWRQTVICIRT